MNWVAPIKDENTLHEFREALKAYDYKYYIMFEIGLGTGMQLQDILKLRVADVRGKDQLVVKIGAKGMETVFTIPDEVKEIINDFIKDREDDWLLIESKARSGCPISREQVYRVFRNVGHQVGLNSIGAQTMRKTFAWRYYKNTQDIYYLQRLFNHASPSITYRYIGEKPNVTVVFKKLTAEENERSRRMLYKDNNGKRRIESLVQMLSNINMELDNPANTDAFYGRVDTLLVQLEEIVDNYKNEP